MTIVPSYRRKLARAKTHIENYETLISIWESKGYRTFEEPKGEGRFIGRAELLKPLPDDLPMIVGDAFQCLRNSLDHIVFALSKVHTPNMTPKDEEIPQFPIGNVATTKNSKRLKFLSRDARKDVCGLAPDPARQPLDQDPLWLLNKMNNRDKHREVALVPSVLATFNYELSRSSGNDYFLAPRPSVLQLGADPVFLYEIARGLGIDAQVSSAPQIRFDQGAEVADREVVATLRWMHDHIRDTVFECLENHF